MCPAQKRRPSRHAKFQKVPTNGWEEASPHTGFWCNLNEQSELYRAGRSTRQYYRETPHCSYLQLCSRHTYFRVSRGRDGGAWISTDPRYTDIGAACAKPERAFFNPEPLSCTAPILENNASATNSLKKGAFLLFRYFWPTWQLEATPEGTEA